MVLLFCLRHHEQFHASPWASSGAKNSTRCPAPIRRSDIGNRLVGRGGDLWPMIRDLVFEFATEAGEQFDLSLAEPVRVVRLADPSKSGEPPLINA